MDLGFQCAACGQWNEIAVDHSAGRNQTYVEDCQVCCRPNLLHVTFNSQTEEGVITSELE